jgi:hypothetical protein
MDTVDLFVVAVGVVYISYKVFVLMRVRNTQVQAKIDAEIDKLHQ